MIKPTRVIVALVAATFLPLAGLSTAATAATPTPAATQRHLVEIPAQAAVAQAVAPSECATTVCAGPKRAATASSAFPISTPWVRPGPAGPGPRYEAPALRAGRPPTYRTVRRL